MKLGGKALRCFITLGLLRILGDKDKVETNIVVLNIRSTCCNRKGPYGTAELLEDPTE